MGQEAAITHINQEKVISGIFVPCIVTLLLSMYKQDIKWSCLCLDPSQSQDDLDWCQHSVKVLILNRTTATTLGAGVCNYWGFLQVTPNWGWGSCWPWGSTLSLLCQLHTRFPSQLLAQLISGSTPDVKATASHRYLPRAYNICGHCNPLFCMTLESSNSLKKNLKK